MFRIQHILLCSFFILDNQINLLYNIDVGNLSVHLFPFNTYSRKPQASSRLRLSPFYKKISQKCNIFGYVHISALTSNNTDVIIQLVINPISFVVSFYSRSFVLRAATPQLTTPFSCYTFVVAPCKRKTVD